MLFNWIKIFIYHLKQNKLFSLLNILGLSIGISGIVFAILYWNNEHAYDAWNPNKETVYQVLNKVGTGDTWATCSAPFGEACRQTIPEIEKVCFMNNWYDEGIVQYREKKTLVENVIKSEDGFFTMFPFPITKGAKENILKEKNSVAISEDAAKNIFKNEDPIGKIIQYNQESYTVKSVFNNHFLSNVHPEYVFSGVVREDDKNSWGNFNYGLMIKIREGVSIEEVLKKMQHLNYVNRTLKDAKENGQTVEQFIKENGETIVLLDQLKTSRLYGQRTNSQNLPEGNGNLQLLYIMVGLSVLILILSIVNYINLATASAIKRAKEVGVRKIVGANKSQIVWQFIFETTLMVAFSILLALAIVELSLPFYNEFLKKELTLNGSEFYIQIISILLLVVLFAGMFPAIYIANFETLKVLKGNFSRSKSGIWIRNSMLVFQFSIAAFFIIGALIVYAQVNFMMNKDLGFKGDQVVRISFNYGDRDKRLEKYITTRQELEKISGVRQVSTFAGSFGYDTNSTSGFSHNGIFVQGHNVDMDYGMLDMMKIKLIAGRDLSPAYASDTISNMLMNETCVKTLNIKDPLNTTITSGFGNENGNIKFKIVGVVKDFNISGFHNKIPPMIFINIRTLKWNNFQNVFVKVDPDNIEETLAKLEAYWKKNINSDYPFQYDFVDKGFAKTYQEQVKQKNLFFILNFIVITIAVFGLFALATYSMERRYREIAIRKTLGAETGMLMKNLSKQYIVFCLLGFGLGIFPAYFLLNQWLENFAYRIPIPVMPFFIALVALLGITLSIVLTKAWQVTRIDILKYLKYE